MEQIAAGIYRLSSLRISNVYIVKSKEELTMIDTGMASDVTRITSQLKEEGLNPDKIRRIVLTHTHVDHIGGAKKLASETGAHIVAHRDEFPHLERHKTSPTTTFIQRFINTISELKIFRQYSLRIDVTVDDGDTLGTDNILTVIHTPGHTPGSISLYNEQHGILFCGDALFNAHPITRKPGLQLPMRIICTDYAQVRDSALKLSKLDIEVLCCGHGESVTENASVKIRELLTR